MTELVSIEQHYDYTNRLREITVRLSGYELDRRVWRGDQEQMLIFRSRPAETAPHHEYLRWLADVVETYERGE